MTRIQSTGIGAFLTLLDRIFKKAIPLNGLPVTLASFFPERRHFSIPRHKAGRLFALRGAGVNHINNAALITALC